MDFEAVLVDEAGLEVVLVGVSEEIGEDLWLIWLTVEVQHVMHRVFGSEAGATPLVRFIWSAAPRPTLRAED